MIKDTSDRINDLFATYARDLIPASARHAADRFQRDRKRATLPFGISRYLDELFPLSFRFNWDLVVYPSPT